MTRDPDSPSVVTRVATEAEAAVLVNLLQDNGIDASACGSFTSSFKAEAPGDVSVVVKQQDLSAAKSILAETEQTKIDWSGVDLGEPE